MMNPQALDQTLDKSPSAKTSPIGSDTTATPGAPSLQAAARHRRRKLLLMAAPAVLVTAVVALKLLSLPLAAGQAAHAYEAGNADGTVRAGQSMGVLNMVERYKSHFAVGDGYVLRGDFAAAKEEFAKALELVPAQESCKVRVNLVLTLEKLGEAKEKAGDTASAMEFFAQGSETVAQAPRDCFAPSSPNNEDGEGDALRDAAKRLQDKQSAAQPGGEGGKDGDGKSVQPAPPPASKMEKLKESGQKAQAERNKGEKVDEFLEQDPEPHAKPW
ncbi:hypothetical protein AS189_10100 [Arthrobacter alpinus]|uniref:Uncharacterized protein n=1 Tax=Arthrobacter alpinus TaxID=656366 RepID=A0A0S2LZB0_9MICC|nr:hypothetical protein [Arthrobacter alpinus]ALO66786.1 hypothetical protein AS189_10100 [Arthrobacter alpinus]